MQVADGGNGMQGVTVFLFGVFSATALAQAQCVVDSGAQRVHLIELYTSEGCSSCPPADRWLNALPDDPARVALAFHVDYWDSPDWRDRFADPRYAQRQRALAAAAGNAIVYTPEVALDGREWRDWGGATPAADSAAPAPSLRLHVDAGPSLHAHLDARVAASEDAGAYVAYFALSEGELASTVRGGENRGARLHHDHVVRALVGPLPLAQADATIAVPSGVRREHAAVVAFVQRAHGSDIANAIALPLQACAAPVRGAE